MKKKEMSFFHLMFRGGEYDTLKEKLLRIIESFGARNFEYPTNPEIYEANLNEIQQTYAEQSETIKLTELQIETILTKLENPRIFSCSLIEEYRLFLLKEKYIYTIMNYFKQDDADVIKVKCWCAESDESTIKQALFSIAKGHGSHQATGEFILNVQPKKYLPPPSHFAMNDFLKPFQEIVNTYGIPGYQEINPGLFTIISFPFLFGVMFGDIGHGFLLFSLGVFLCFNQKIKGLRDFRYLFLLMGFFSIFCGFIYNEIFSIPLNLFGSCYLKSEKIVSREEACVYPFGLDPIWGVSTNELAFFNSFKMKMAVIIGVSQMTLGILLKGFNTLFHCNFLDFFFEFLPQLFFMGATFIYLDILIIIKWTIDWDHLKVSPPSLIQQFLNLGLKMGTVDENPLFGAGNEQEYLQRILFIIALLMVPMMLVMKPVILYTFRKIEEKNLKKKEIMQKEQKKRSSGMELYFEESEEKPLMEEGKSSPDNEFKEVLHKLRDYDSSSDELSPIKHKKIEPMSEIIVHQIIETIEFVLGSISNTASYLRLWALSLAHSQLSKVFFDMTLMDMIEKRSVIGIIVGFFLFANITLAVLMCMDVMECFLHALRLHWVEFQNKFFKADGYKFQPLSFKELLTPELQS